MSDPVTKVPDAEAMQALGASLAEGARAALRAGAPATFVYLRGPLGAGKTTLARGLLAALGVRGPVRSPTYALVESYPLMDGKAIHHLDLYRIAVAEDLDDLGVRDLAGEAAVILVEWPERGERALPAPDLVVDIALDGAARRVSLRAHGARGRAAWPRGAVTASLP